MSEYNIYSCDKDIEWLKLDFIGKFEKICYDNQYASTNTTIIKDGEKYMIRCNILDSKLGRIYNFEKAIEFWTRGNDTILHSATKYMYMKLTIA